MTNEIIYTEHRKRRTAKISGDASQEEIRSLLANWRGIPYGQVDPQEVENAHAELQKQSKNKAEVRAIIEPFYSELKGNPGTDDAKKLSELITIGRFIRQIDWPIRILECSERPDFIIEFQGRRVGVELTQLFDEGSVREIADLKSIVRTVEDKLRSYKPDIGLLNLYLDAGQIQINGKHINQFRKQGRIELANTIYDCVLLMVPVRLPASTIPQK